MSFSNKLSKTVEFSKLINFDSPNASNQELPKIRGSRQRYNKMYFKITEEDEFDSFEDDSEENDNKNQQNNVACGKK